MLGKTALIPHAPVTSPVSPPAEDEGMSEAAHTPGGRAPTPSTGSGPFTPRSAHQNAVGRPGKSEPSSDRPVPTPAYGTAKVAPAAHPRRTLARLHDSTRCRSHERRGRNCFWPGRSDITSTLQAREPARPQPITKGTNWRRPPPQAPFPSISPSFFSVAREAFLVIRTDPPGAVVVPCGAHTTAPHTIGSSAPGFPGVLVSPPLRMRRAPKFTSSLPELLRRRWGVYPAVFSPHYPQSKGHAGGRPSSRNIDRKTSTGPGASNPPTPGRSPAMTFMATRSAPVSYPSCPFPKEWQSRKRRGDFIAQLPPLL
ncbi:hypothetical protein GWK47_034562 [Chionoecetes opilio]|uniref:Uncharacterized protein n=1 Tax=Chionoecetes opilio TaxID=41210 RepID=A0A8J5CP25_CHIOP|nr:hypothetical protein GWK47_034562 [Chionoecetes opilio]